MVNPSYENKKGLETLLEDGTPDILELFLKLKVYFGSLVFKLIKRLLVENNSTDILLSGIPPEKR